MVQPATAQIGRFSVAGMLFSDNPSKEGQDERLHARVGGGGTRVKRVLLVEKDKLFRQVLALVLKWNTDLKESFEADSLANARRTLNNVGHKPDLAVVDLDLANAEGFELIRELRTSAPEVPVLAITLRQEADRRERALRAGAEEVLPMAASPKQIVDVAKRLLGE